MNANSFKTILNSTVSISDLTRAGAKKIFDSLNNDESKIVLKNNKPIAALVSTDRYQELLEKEEDLQLIQLAMSRKAENQTTISRESFYENNGITEDFLSDLPEIELE
ncbi:MAG: type II toxin-antitoxin system Phd/YefM family antitoxin [Erysipelotrichaceae bacterium]